MAAAINDQVFADPEAMAVALASRIGSVLGKAVAARGSATLVVPGGTTPGATFRHLADTALPWDRVTVTLGDERWVPLDSPRSNEGQLRHDLLFGTATRAHLVGLRTDAATPEDGLAEVEARLRALPRPFDFVLLGMGDDGHTASLFPGADGLVEAMAEDNVAMCAPIRAPGAPEPRITLTLRALLDTRTLAIAFNGAAKAGILERARAGEDLPIAAVLNRSRVPVEIFRTA